MKYIFGLALLLVVSTANAGRCDGLYPHATVISPINTIELCNDEYVSRYNETNRQVILVSERIQPTGHVIPRKDSFHADRRVANPVIPADYLRTGHDRGHMAPADDAVSASQMYESFLMTNMTPQNPSLNRGAWKRLEILVRDTIATTNVPTVVVTGALYNQPAVVNGIPKPNAYYKIAYYATGTKVYYADNKAGSAVRELPIDRIESLSGLRFPR